MRFIVWLVAFVCLFAAAGLAAGEPAHHPQHCGPAHCGPRYVPVHPPLAYPPAYPYYAAPPAYVPSYPYYVYPVPARPGLYLRAPGVRIGLEF